MTEELNETTTQTVYKADVERIVSRYGKPFANALSRVLDDLEMLSNVPKMSAEFDVVQRVVGAVESLEVG